MKLIKEEKTDTLHFVLEKFDKAQHLLDNKAEYLRKMIFEDENEDSLCGKIDMCVDDFVDFEINHEEHINKVNEMKTTWTAGPNSHSTKASDVRKNLGTVIDPEWTLKLPTKSIP